jgi:hypothetical protein
LPNITVVATGPLPPTADPPVVGTAWGDDEALLLQPPTARANAISTAAQAGLAGAPDLVGGAGKEGKP